MLEVSYPPRGLNPNRHTHWAKTHRLKANYGTEVYVLAKDAMRKGLLTVPATERIGLHLQFVQPHAKRKRDDDNVEAAFKAGRDGLAAALGIDDGRFVTTKELLPADPKHKHGLTIINLTPVR